MPCTGCAKRKAALVKSAKRALSAIERIRARIAERLK